MCPFRISAFSQPTLPLPGTSVPERFLWPELPEAVRCRALVVLADLLARHAAVDISPDNQDAGLSPGAPVPDQQGGRR